MNSDIKNSQKDLTENNLFSIFLNYACVQCYMNKLLTFCVLWLKDKKSFERD